MIREPRAGANAKVLIEEKGVFALLLCRGTPHSEAIMPHLKAKGVPLIAPSTGADLLHNPVNPYIFNVRAKYQLEAQKGVEQLAAMGMQRIGVIHVEDSFGKDALAGAMKGFAAAKVLVEGLKRAGETLTRQSFLKALEGLHDYDLGGLKVDYSPTDHTGTEYVELSMIGREGQFVQR